MKEHIGRTVEATECRTGVILFYVIFSCELRIAH